MKEPWEIKVEALEAKKKERNNQINKLRNKKHSFSSVNFFRMHDEITIAGYEKEIEEIDKEINGLKITKNNDISLGSIKGTVYNAYEKVNSFESKIAGKLEERKKNWEDAQANANTNAMKKKIKKRIAMYDKVLKSLKKHNAKVQGKQRNIICSKFRAQHRLYRLEGRSEYRNDKYDDMVTYAETLKNNSFVFGKAKGAIVGIGAKLYKKIPVAITEQKLNDMRNRMVSYKGGRYIPNININKNATAGRTL